MLWFILFLCNSLALWNCVLVLLCQLHENYKVNLCHLLQHGEICMWALSYLVCWAWKVHKGFYFDFFVFLNFFVSLYICLFVLEEKKIGEKFQFSWSFVFLHYFLCVFLLSLKSFKAIVPNFLEIFMVIDFFVHNILGSLNVNWVLVP